MWDLPRPGLEPVSPALAGGFSTTAPPGKPSLAVLLLSFWDPDDTIIRSSVVATQVTEILLMFFPSWFIFCFPDWIISIVLSLSSQILPSVFSILLLFLSVVFFISVILLFVFYKFIYLSLLFLAALGLRCCTRALSSCCEQWLVLLRSMGSRHTGFSSRGLRAQQLWHTGSVAPWRVGSSRTRAQTRVPCIGRWTFNHCVTREVCYFTFWF